MKRLFTILLLLGLLASGCGGDAPDHNAGQDGIAALEQDDDAKDEKDARERGEKKRARKKSRAEERAAKHGKNPNSGDAVVEDSSEGATAATASNGSTKRTATAAVPIPTGRYEYATEGRTTLSGNSRDLPESTSLTAHAPTNGVQSQVRDLRDREGNGTVTETRLLYRSDGVFLSYVKVTSKFPGGITDVREFDLPNPELIAPVDGGPGFKRSFLMRGSGTRADVTIKALRYEKVTVSGSPVRALVVKTRIMFSGSLEGEQISMSWFWPKHVLVLKEEVHMDVTNGPIRLRSDYDALLRRLP